MIRVVVDTNIVVSAFFWGGIPHQILAAARDNRIRIISTEVLIDELADVISRPKFAERIAKIGMTADSLLNDGYRALIEVVEPAIIEPVIEADPDDDILIACALGGAADYIISGDHHLLDLGTYQTIKIRTAKQFLDELTNTE